MSCPGAMVKMVYRRCEIALDRKVGSVYLFVIEEVFVKSLKFAFSVLQFYIADDRSKSSNFRNRAINRTNF